MSWKYVLVGLALIFPGNLLFVDGRESKEFGDTSADDGSVLKSLLEYFRNRRVDHDPSDVSSEDNSKDASEDFNHQVADIENNEKIIGPDNSQNSQFPASDRHDSSDERGTPKMKEVTGEVQQPLALAIRQQEHRSSTTKESVTNGMTFILIVTGCTVLAAIGVVGAGVCWYKYNKRAKSASVVDYPAYGVTGPTKDRLPSPGDRKLAQSAQMYHYQHQKQQMIAMEKANGSMKHDASDEESEEENVEGDYTVYECPGLAPTGEMEVKNPLFRGDETPSTPVNEEPPQPEDK